MNILDSAMPQVVLPSASSSSAKETIHCSNVKDLPVPSLSSASVAEIASSQQLAHLSHSPSFYFD